MQPLRSRKGVATYRHLLSPSSLTPQNPLRVIALVDIDAAYAQFEQVRLGLPSDRPLVCAQWQSLIAVNYPARKFGIKRFHTIDEAKKMCPDLYVQHVATYRNGEAEAGYWDDPDPRTHKVSLDVYRRESQKIIAVFNSIIVKGEIEKASIDEAFLDLTLMVFERLLIRFPYLATIPEGTTLDTPLPSPPPIDWSKAGTILPVPGEDEKAAEDTADTEAQVEAGTYQDTWEDWALCLGAELMAELRAEVYDKLRYTCSAGISHGKAMAKLSAGHKKPNNQTVLRSAAVAAFLRDEDFTEIRMLGGKLGTAIAEQFQVKTVGDLLTIPLEDLQNRFGEEAVWVYNVIRGIDHSEVTPRLATKSMLASKNTRPPVTTPEQGVQWIGILAGELFVRLREAREIAPGLWPKSIVIGHRTGIETARHRQAPFPYTKNLSTAYICKYAEKLWAEVCQPMSRGGMKLNNMSLSFAGLERLEEGQKGIEGFFAAKSVTPARAGDTPRKEPAAAPSAASAGAASVKKPQPRLPTLHTKRRSPLDGFLTKPGQSASDAGPSRSRRTTPSPAEVIDLVGEEQSVEDDTMGEGEWRCPKCGVTLRETGDEAAGNVEAQRQEHEDYHFALSLQNGPSPKRAKVTAKTGNEGTKGKVKKKEGIKAFFAPKPGAK